MAAKAGRARRRTIGIAIGALVLLVALVVAGLPFYVFPAQTAAKKSDVVFVLGPPDPWRITYAEQLMREGIAHTLLVSNPTFYLPTAPSICRADAPAEAYTVICIPPSPSTTQGEARMLRAQMTLHGWTTATVITATPHISRSRVILARCVPTGVNVVGRSDGLSVSDWVYQYFYQTGAFVKVWLSQGC